jgi:hypothetical protein
MLRTEFIAAAPDTYVAKVCDGGFLPPGCRLFSVTTGALTELENRPLPDSEWATQDVADAENPLEVLLAQLTLEGNGSCVSSFDLDATFKFVSGIYHTCLGESFGSSVRCFVPDTSDLEACRYE